MGNRFTNGGRQMRTVVINGRQMQIPAAADAEDIRRAGGISEGRTIIRRTREGSFVVRPGEQIAVQDDEHFADAPARIKGRH
jgi:hypothetical protein